MYIQVNTAVHIGKMSAKYLRTALACAVFCLMDVECYSLTKYVGSVSSVGVVGGKEVSISEVPFMAMYRPRDKMYFCGATIVHPKYVISAAHCYHFMKMLEESTPQIFVGTDKANTGGMAYDIASTHVHPKFTLDRADYDIVILELVKTLKFSDTVQPIPLAKKGLKIPEGAVFDTMGFGIKSALGEKSYQLMKVSVKYVSTEECQPLYRGFNLTERMICAGEDRKGSCSGDGGGPLTYEGTLLGVVSRMLYCDKHPSIYTSVPALREFIDRIVPTDG